MTNLLRSVLIFFLLNLFWISTSAAFNKCPTLEAVKELTLDDAIYPENGWAVMIANQSLGTNLSWTFGIDLKNRRGGFVYFQDLLSRLHEPPESVKINGQYLCSYTNNTDDFTALAWTGNLYG